MTELTKLFQAIFSVVIVSGFYLGFVPALVLEQKLKKAALPPIIEPVYETFQVTFSRKLRISTVLQQAKAASKEDHEKQRMLSPSKAPRTLTSRSAHQNSAPKSSHPVPCKNSQTPKVLTTKVKRPSQIVAYPKQHSAPSQKQHSPWYQACQEAWRWQKNQKSMQARFFTIQENGHEQIPLAQKPFSATHRIGYESQILGKLSLGKVNKKGSVIGIKITGLRCKSHFNSPASKEATLSLILQV